MTPHTSEALAVQLLLSTPQAVVVPVRLELQSDDGPSVEEGTLVIGRARCEGDRPSWHALVEAAGALACRGLRPRHGRARAIARVMVRPTEAEADGWIELAGPAGGRPPAALRHR